MRVLVTGASGLLGGAVARAVARLDGVSFPSTVRLAGRWLRGRDAYVARGERDRPRPRPEEAYCAEVVALTMQEMGLLVPDRRASWYDPGTFWSGEYLPLAEGWSYGLEVPVRQEAV